MIERMPLLGPLRQPVFARFFAGQAISRVGDELFRIALVWQVIEIAGTSGALGSVLAVFFGGLVAFLIVGGVIVDRLPRRRVIVASDLLQALLAAIVTALALSGRLTLGALYPLAFLFGAAQAFAMPALQAFVPQTVPASLLQPANSLTHGTRTLIAIGGPALGAGIVAAGGTTTAFGLNALSFLASAAFLASARPLPEMAQPLAGRASMLEEARQGLRYVRRVPWLWATILLFSLINVAENGPRNVVLPVFVVEAYGAGVAAVGLLMTSMAAGSLVGSLLLGLGPPIRRRGLTAYSAVLVSGLGLAGLALTRQVWHAHALMFAIGVAFSLFNVLWQTNMMEEVEERYRGRAFSLDMLLSFALLPLSSAGAGWLAEIIGPRQTFLAGGLVVLACSAVGLLYRPARAFTETERVGAIPDTP